jgi:hypothetical protein
MKTWLRLIVVVMTVGGGFAGFVVTLQTLLQPHNQKSPSLLSMIVVLGLYAYITISGLIFVADSSRTAPILGALALQVPWISSPVVTYIFGSGLNIFVGGRPQQQGGLYFSFDFLFGSSWRFSFLQDAHWRIGVNLFALILLILVWKVRHTTREPAPIVAAPPQEPTDRAESPSC